MSKGTYIVIDGNPATGKSTLIERLARELQATQIPVQIIADAARPQDVTAQVMRRIIEDPRYPVNTRAEVLLYNAIDSRLIEAIQKAVDAGVVCITDSSFLTTLVNEYYGRGDITDYAAAVQITQFANGSLKPDLHIILDAPVEALKQRMSADRRTGIDDSYLERVRAGYLWEAKQRGLPIIYTTDSLDTVFANTWGHVRSTVGVQEKVAKDSKVQSVSEVLAANPPTKVAPSEPPIIEKTVVEPQDIREQIVEDPQEAATEQQEQTAATPTEAWTKKRDNGSILITAAGKKELSKYVTDVDASVYGFTDTIAPTTIAAAMAHISQQDTDMRAALLDTLIEKIDTDTTSPHSLITDYGNDPLRQLTSQYIVVEGASNLLTKKLEWGNLASYIEQSTRYIHFDRKDANGRYRYHTPSQLKGKLRSQYITTMNQIFDIYAKLATDLIMHIRTTSVTPAKDRDAAWRSATKAQAYDAIRPLLPVAAKSTVGIYASNQMLEDIVMHLLSDELPEARSVGQRILDEARKTAPDFFEGVDKPNKGGITNEYQEVTYTSVKRLAEKLLPPNHTAETNPVTLDSYTPHNELDSIADMLYQHGDLPLAQLRQEVVHWPYQQKVDVLTTYIGERQNQDHRPGRALEKIRYSFDLVCGYDIFLDLQRYRMVDDLEWQILSPRLGYDVPQLIDEAGATDAFEQCFDLSLGLYSLLQGSGFALEAQYATLLGHKMRWKVTYNAREAFHLYELTDSEGYQSYHKLVEEMRAKIAEVHPLLASAMQFVHQREDPKVASSTTIQGKREQVDSPKSKG